VRRLFLFLGLFLAALPGRAQQPPLHDALLDNLAGHWVITGTIAGAAATHDLDAEWVLDHHYLRLHEVSRERDRDGRPRYEAYVHIGWNPATATYGCIWLDTFGGLTTESVGIAPRAADRLAFAFARDGQVTLRNVMTWHADSRTWDWMIVNVDGARSSTFATLVLRRP
jgi:hypothetical protein